METNRETRQAIAVELQTKFTTNAFFCIPVFIKNDNANGKDDTVWKLTYYVKETGEPKPEFNGYMGRTSKGVTYSRTYTA